MDRRTNTSGGLLQKNCIFLEFFQYIEISCVERDWTGSITHTCNELKSVPGVIGAVGSTANNPRRIPLPSIDSFFARMGTYLAASYHNAD